METVGVYLKKERESKNISLREVSRLTKISEFYLDYIEKNEFEKLPQGPYVKGYIASYSRLIGGNADQAIQLYESLNRKRAQADEIQPEFSKKNGRNILPEKPKAIARKNSNNSPSGTTLSSFKTVASYVKAKSASLKAATLWLKKNVVPFKKISAPLTAIISKQKPKTPSAAAAARAPKENIGPIFKKTVLAVTANRWLTHQRIWLYGFIVLFGTALMVLAGFGFYHLFIYDQNRFSVAELQKLQEETLPLTATGSEKSVLLLKPTDAPLTADQLEGHANNKRPSALNSQPIGPKQSSSLLTSPDAALPPTTLNPENSTGTPKPAIQAGALFPGSSSTVENSASGQTTAGEESRVPSGQIQMSAGPSPESTTADADLIVLQASVCSEIKNRMPVGVDTSFSLSAQRVYVWNEIEARKIPSKIRHIYYQNGKKISEVTLDVRSSYWRTWSSKNISNNRDRGQWRVDIATASGKVLRRLTFEVR